MEWWSFIWIAITITIIFCVLESLHRRARRRRAAIREQELIQAQTQLRNQQYHVYTVPTSNNTTFFANMPQPPPPNQMYHQHLKVDDSPPKYEDILFDSQGNVVSMNGERITHESVPPSYNSQGNPRI